MTCTHPNCTASARWSFDGRSVCRTHAVELAARGRPGRLLPDERQDVVARLRAGCEFAEDSDMDPESFMCHRIECEAADEIERLRAEIKRLRREAGQAGPA